MGTTTTPILGIIKKVIDPFPSPTSKASTLLSLLILQPVFREMHTPFFLLFNTSAPFTIDLSLRFMPLLSRLLQPYGLDWVISFALLAEMIPPNFHVVNHSFPMPVSAIGTEPPAVCS